VGYDSSIYILADEELKRRKSKAEREQSLRFGEAVLKIPELASVEKEISSAGLLLVKAVGMGQDAQRYIEDLAKKNLAAQKKRKELLKDAGFPADYLDVRYSCPECMDTGFVEGIRCGCYGRLLRSLAREKLLLDAPSCSGGFDTFKLGFYPKAVDPRLGVSPYARMKEVLNFCKSYAADFGLDSPSILMTGETGLGKTHLSLAIGLEAVDKGFGVIYGSAQNLLNKIEREHFGKNGNESETVQSLLDCDLLILDDLGSEFSTQFTVSVIYNIINTRLLRELPVIISTNLTVEELESRYSRRVTSRIIGNYVTLAFYGSDIRQLIKD
jgi:DNA replication protein DnaC